MVLREKSLLLEKFFVIFSWGFWPGLSTITRQMQIFWARQMNIRGNGGLCSEDGTHDEDVPRGGGGRRGQDLALGDD